MKDECMRVFLNDVGGCTGVWLNEDELAVTLLTLQWTVKGVVATYTENVQKNGCLIGVDERKYSGKIVVVQDTELDDG